MVNFRWLSSRNKVYPEFYLTTQTNVKQEDTGQYVGLVNFKTSEVIIHLNFQYRCIRHTPEKLRNGQISQHLVRVTES